MTSHPGGSNEREAEFWLAARGIGRKIIDAILGVLELMWRGAFEAGEAAANQAAGTTVTISPQQVQTSLTSLVRQWVSQIATTTISLIAGAIAAAKTFTVAGLTTAVMAVLSDLKRARTIAITEITRAMALAAQWVYQIGGLIHIRWVTEHDAKVCPSCQSNQDAGRWPLGVPIPSGALFPPDHVNCRCAIVPA